MSYANYPSSENPQLQLPAPKDNRKLIYGILIAALLITWGYIIYDKNKTKETINTLQIQYNNVDSAKTVVQQEYNEALAKMDSLTGTNTKLNSELSQKKLEIDRLKANIKHELAKKNADISKLNNLVAELKGKVSDLFAQIDQLKAENQTLTANNQDLTNQRDTLTTQKQQLSQNLSATKAEKAHVEDVASTLHASNINIEAIDVKDNGKEKATTKAKRADLLRISFELDENRVAPSGKKELYVIVTSPDGKTVTIPANGSGSFATREEGNKLFTNKVEVQYEQGKRTPVSFDWKQDGRFQIGDYKIEIYHNGYKIGGGVKTLKKAGLFG